MKVANKPKVFEPEARAAFIDDPLAFACRADVLARESAAQYVDGFDVFCIYLSYVLVYFLTRPTRCEHAPGIVFNFAKPGVVKSSPVQPKVA
jgi:hypothetical protein